MDRPLSFVILFVLLAVSVFSQPNDSPVLQEPYLGQEPPGLKPVVFAPGIVSKEGLQCKLNITPDGGEIIYAERNAITNRWSFMRMVRIDGKWSQLGSLPFSEEYTNMEPSLSPDGKRLYYVSDRPINGTGEAQKTPDIWYVDKTGNDWGNPVNLGSPINSDEVEVQPFHAQDNNFYFCKSPGEIYCSKFLGGVLTTPIRLDDSINDEKASGPWITPDNNYMIFQSRSEGGLGGWDLYVSFRKTDSTWGKAINMGGVINTAGNEGDATISPDGRYIFFSKDSDIYWISAKIIEESRPKE